MATTRHWFCRKCGYTAVRSLFDALKLLAKGGEQLCAGCSKPARLQLDFNLGLNAKNSECFVLDCFLPKRLAKWTDLDGNEVAFYPFLVVLRRERKKALCLPYWRLVSDGGKTLKKYGQWAPFMDKRLFDNMLKQAPEKGYDF